MPKKDDTRTTRPEAPFDLSLRTLLRVVMVSAGIWLIIKIWPVLVALVVTLVLVGTLNPLVCFLERHLVRRWLALLIVFLGLAISAVMLGLVTIPSLVEQLAHLVEEAPAIQTRTAEQMRHMRLMAPLADLVRNGKVIEILSTMAKEHALEYSSRIITIITYTVTSIFLTIYLLADRDHIRGIAYALVPRAYHLRLARILLNLETIVGGYMRGQVITSIGMAVFVFGLLSLCHVPNALALAVFAGLSDVLPFIGGLLVIIPSALAASSRGPGMVVGVVIALVLYQEFESRILIPRIYGNILRLSSAAVLLAILIGGELFGILGALLALPIAAALRMILEELRVELPGDATDDTTLRERDERAEEEYAQRTAGTPAKEAAVIATEMADDIRHADAKDDMAKAAEVPVTGGKP